MRDKIVVFGDSPLADDIKTHLEMEGERFIKISDASSYENDDSFFELGFAKDISKCFILMESLETNVLLILSIRSIDRDVKIFTRSGSHIESEKLKLAGADEILDYNRLTAHRIFNVIQQPNVTNVLDRTIFTETGVQILESLIDEESQYLGRNLLDIELQSSILIGAVSRERGEFIFAQESYIIEIGDTLIFLYE